MTAGQAARERAGVDLRRAMRRQASTVAIVTTRIGTDSANAQPVGCTVTSLVSVSLAPPLILFSLRTGSRLERAWRSADRGVVHLLHDGQEGLSRRFASEAHDRFSREVQWRWSSDRCPVLLDALAWLTVATAQRVPAGDHVLVVARVLRVVESVGESPLLYHDGGYTRLRERESPRPCHTAVAATGGGSSAAPWTGRPRLLPAPVEGYPATPPVVQIEATCGRR